MPTVAATRTIGAAPEAIWDVVGDPHHLPRWWPRVVRVEGVDDRAFTEVLTGKRGKVVRADFDLVEASAPRRVVWSQQVAGTPFEAVLRSAVTTIELSLPADGGGDRAAVPEHAVASAIALATEVRLELSQELVGRRGGGDGRGIGSLLALGVAPIGGPLVRRAAVRTLEQALDGLESAVAR